MGPRIEMHVDPKQMEVINNFLRTFPKDAPRAIMRACNRTAVHTRKLLIRVLQQNVALPRWEFVARKTGLVQFIRATLGGLGARLQFRGRRISLARFGARQMAGKSVTVQSVRTHRTSKRWVGGGITYRVRTGGPRTWAPLFLGKLRRGGMAAFGRSGKGRGDIRVKYGPSAPRALIHDPATREKLQSDAAPWFIRQLHSQLALIMSRLLKRGGGGGSEGYDPDEGEGQDV